MAVRRNTNRNTQGSNRRVNNRQVKNISSMIQLAPKYPATKNPDNAAILGNRRVQGVTKLGQQRYNASPDVQQTALDLEPYKEAMLQYLWDNQIPVNDPEDIYEIATRFGALEFGNQLPSEATNYLIDTWSNADIENLDQNGKNILNSIFGAIGGAFNGLVGATQQQQQQGQQLTPFEQTLLDTNQNINDQITTYATNKASSGLGKIALPIVIVLVGLVIVYGVWKLFGKK